MCASLGDVDLKGLGDFHRDAPSLLILDNIQPLRRSNGFIHFYNFLTLVCTVTSIFLPDWLTYYNTTTKLHIHLAYGLTKHCSSYSHPSARLTSRITRTCHSFPSKQDCSSSPRLCYTWRSASSLIILAAVLEGITLVAYLMVFNGGYVRRLNGWKVLSLLHLLIGIIYKRECV